MIAEDLPMMLNIILERNMDQKSRFLKKKSDEFIGNILEEHLRNDVNDQ